MSYRFKVERGWASSGYGAKNYWNDPDVFHVNAETEREATQKVAAISDLHRLAQGNRYLYRVVSAEELPPEAAPPPQPQPFVNPLRQNTWRGTAGRVR